MKNEYKWIWNYKKNGKEFDITFFSPVNKTFVINCIINAHDIKEKDIENLREAING